MFHAHKWEEVSRHYTEPIHDLSMKNANQEAIERLLWGVTVVILQCITCGDKKSVECLGRSTK